MGSPLISICTAPQAQPLLRNESLIQGPPLRELAIVPAGHATRKSLGARVTSACFKTRTPRGSWSCSSASGGPTWVREAPDPDAQFEDPLDLVLEACAT